ncbi:hypothetical protein [Gloeocapsopsis sp. IPPAS B-1203]|uniref:hypothetical protein n=1 Tax=Gloeocapsopsis sp. IPPAS B-1203 TaxID=2049454 RepID=UPI000C17E02B|nr:hypothetical protein [Gloeocapsopsis sp. IPPAS B-1203]PIG90673.1 hypothetical protein CSQ79_25250 [Gloeocapsopsis sp. IPPAS B-1203]
MAFSLQCQDNAQTARSHTLVYDATVTVWILLLLIRFTLISWVALDREIRMQGKDTPTDFATVVIHCQL